MGVGNLPADDGDEVGFTAGDDGFGVVGGSDPGLRRYPRMFNNRFQLRCEGGGEFLALGKRRDDPFEIKVGAVAAGNVVDVAGGVVQGDDFAEIFGT